MFELLLFSQLVIGLLVFNSQSPLFMSLLIILLALVQGLTSFFLFSKWVGLSLIMIFVGGMMVVFLYVSSLSSNNKFVITKNLLVLGVASGLFLWISLFFAQMSFNSLSIAPSSIFLKTSSPLIMFIVMYLLMTLFISTKMAEGFKGSLIQKF